jgi:glycosyltransferase involved in cell wall biosynthesis/intein/homing endonuclease
MARSWSDNKKTILIWGDSPSAHSVTNYTPILIRNNKTKEIDIMAISDIYDSDFVSPAEYKGTDKDGVFYTYKEVYNHSVYDSSNGNQKWTKIKHVSRHFYEGNIKSVYTKWGAVEATPNHSFLYKNGKTVKAEALTTETELLVHELKPSYSSFANYFIGTEELAWLYGFFAAEGSIKNVGKTGEKTPRIFLYNQEINILEKAQNIAQKNLSVEGYINKSTEDGTFSLALSGSKLALIFKKEFYTKDLEKKVPKSILNSPKNIQKAFIDGYMVGDGRKNNKGYKSKSQVLAQGILWMMQYCGGYGKYSIYFSPSKKQVVEIKLSEFYKSKNKCTQPINILDREYKGFVYDLETETHHFVAGVGSMVVHNTGFGNVLRELGYRLKSKYNLAFLGINSNGDPTPESEDFHIFPPNKGDVRGRDRINELLLAIKPDIFFTLNDYDAVLEVPQPLSNARQQLNMNIPWVHYFPVDGEPFYEKYANFLKDWVDFPVVTTDWGAEVVKKADSALNVPVIYHGVDTKTFAPLDEEMVQQEKVRNGMDNKFVVLMVGVNQIRKQYGTALQAFAEFSKDKEDVMLILHTQKYLMQGWDIPTIVRRLHEQYENEGHQGLYNKVAYTGGVVGHQGVFRQQMQMIYNIADAFLHTSVGEGFGLPLVEAASTGLPIIAQKATVMPELLGKNAMWCKTDDTMYFPFSDRSLERPLISKKDIIRHLNKLYEDREYGQKLGAKARKAVLNNSKFNWDNIANQFDELFMEALEDKREVSLDVAEVL